VIEDSSLHLNAPENAVNSHKVSILMEHGALTIIRKRGYVKEPNFGHRLHHLDTPIRPVEK
jgi:hypothetical protein